MGLFVFIVGVVLLLGAVAAFATAVRLPRRQVRYSKSGVQPVPSARAGTFGIALVLFLVGGVLLFLDSFTVVGPRAVAVQKVFGQVQDTHLGSGWHWVKPWHDVEEFDASVQTLKFYQVDKKDNGDCLTVRLANSTNACVDVTAQWNINHTGDVNGLYLDYRTFDNIHDNLVLRQLQSALNEVFGSYDPLVAVGTVSDRPQVNTKDLQERVRIALQRDLGNRISIPSVTIPLVHFDTETENSLRGYQLAKANTRIAEQNALTAAQQAQANRALADQPASRDPGVQYQNCLNLTQKLAADDQLKNLPLTWNCRQGGAGDQIIVQQK